MRHSHKPMRVLRKHGYPPDKEEKATQTVLEQAELLSENRRSHLRKSRTRNAGAAHVPSRREAGER
jgi:hypothetical protein